MADTQAGGFHCVTSLSSHTLLTAKARREDWHHWAMHFGQSLSATQVTRQFDHMHLVLQAAMEGQGIALCPTSLLGTHLLSGQLICPLPELRVPLPRYLRCGAGRDGSDTGVCGMVVCPDCSG
ncbi:LysR substrate-binding domain-containing protein [Pseudomonas mandelii]|nr:LysR substrate-binding domain-containing protein [Pseudomonas mandelii]